MTGSEAVTRLTVVVRLTLAEAVRDGGAGAPDVQRAATEQARAVVDAINAVAYTESESLGAPATTGERGRLPGLTDAQHETVLAQQALAVPASWFVSAHEPGGAAEVIAIGGNQDDGAGFVWSFIIEPDGECASSEAPLGVFSTGIDV